MKYSDWKVLETEADYDAALAYVESFMDARPNSLEEKALESIALLIEKYEQIHYPMDD